MSKNPKNKEIISILVLCGIITAVGTVILMKIGYEFKYSIIGGALLTILLIVPKKRFVFKASYTVDGHVVVENIWADSKYEAQNLIYSKYPGQVVENITIITLSGK